MANQALEFSSLTDYDSICLIATYNSLQSGATKNTQKLESRGYTPEQLALTKQKATEKFNAVTSCGVKFTKPFDHLKFEPFGYVQTLFENYERGCLPFPGSVAEQPAQIMEIFSVLRQLKLETEIKISESLKPNGRQPKGRRTK